jgi:hypothetical protein
VDSSDPVILSGFKAFGRSPHVVVGVPRDVALVDPVVAQEAQGALNPGVFGGHRRQAVGPDDRGGHRREAVAVVAAAVAPRPISVLGVLDERDGVGQGVARVGDVGRSGREARHGELGGREVPVVGGIGVVPAAPVAAPVALGALECGGAVGQRLPHRHPRTHVVGAVGRQIQRERHERGAQVVAVAGVGRAVQGCEIVDHPRHDAAQAGLIVGRGVAVAHLGGVPVGVEGLLQEGEGGQAVAQLL